MKSVCIKIFSSYLARKTTIENFNRLAYFLREKKVNYWTLILLKCDESNEIKRKLTSMKLKAQKWLRIKFIASNCVQRLSLEIKYFKYWNYLLLCIKRVWDPEMYLRNQLPVKMIYGFSRDIKRTYRNSLVFVLSSRLSNCLWVEWKYEVLKR